MWRNTKTQGPATRPTPSSYLEKSLYLWALYLDMWGREDSSERMGGRRLVSLRIWISVFWGWTSHHRKYHCLWIQINHYLMKITHHKIYHQQNHYFQYENQTLLTWQYQELHFLKSRRSSFLLLDLCSTLRPSAQPWLPGLFTASSKQQQFWNSSMNNAYIQ